MSPTSFIDVTSRLRINNEITLQQIVYPPSTDD